MIRLIQKRLIIPRGDTGTFSIPVLAGKDSNDVSIFTIFDPLTHKKIFEKKVEPSEGMLHITFTHGDTVNLPIGQYVWDIKFYTDPVFAEEQLVDGTEVDSYYALFNLPICEIRETGDNMLYGDDAPAATLAPDQIDLITRSLADIHTSMQTAIDSATAAEQYATSAGDSATAAETSASSAIDAAASALENKNAAALSAQEAAASVASLFNALPTKISDLIDDSGHYIKPANGIPASDLEETYLTSFTETDPTVPSWAKEAQKPSYTAAEVGAMATDHPANDITAINIENWTKKTNLFDVSSDRNNAYDYWWTLTIPRNALWNIHNAPGTSGKLKYLYVPSIEGKNLIRLELPTTNGQLALITDTPAWARAANKPTYTAQEVGALPADTVIPTVPTNVSAFTNDAGYITGYTETDPTVPAWAKASTKPSYTAAEVGAPTVAEMNSAISTAIGNINSFDMAVVQELPTQNISTHTIYLVPKTGETNDVYDEYIYINNAWEMIGNTQIDLSNYATKGEIPSVPVQDVQVNGTSILNNGIAIIPVRSNIVGGSNDLVTSEGINNTLTGFFNLTDNQIKGGTQNYRAIAPITQHKAVFYGLAKAAGDTTQKVSSNAVGTYTEEAKTAIRTMLGVATPADIPTNVSAFTNDAGYLTQHQDISGKANAADLAVVATSGSYEDLSNKPTIPEVPVQDVQINGSSVLSNGVANIPVAANDGSTFGVVKVDTQNSGVAIDENGVLNISRAIVMMMKTGTDQTHCITPGGQHTSVYYGLSKLAGVDLKNETVTVGTYPETSKTAIRSLIGAAAASDIPSVPVQDIQINGASIVSNGIANFAIASPGTLGVIKVSETGTFGLSKVQDLDANNQLYYTGEIAIQPASNGQIKGSSGQYNPITPTTQHRAVFFGLAKAAGDSTQSASSNAIGTYTDGAKSAIQTMLGITDALASKLNVAEAGLRVVRLI